MAERLQKVISQAGVTSRRDAEKIITAGRVKVNGKTVSELGTKVELEDVIKIDGKAINREKLVYVLLNKPKGVVTTLKDPEGRETVASLVKDISERIYPVGRLDYHTEGLLLITNDGNLTQAITHPRHHIPKVYEVKVLGLPSDEQLDKLRQGIKLEDGLTQPAKVILLNRDQVKNVSELEVTIFEGKNRQIRRMFEAIGHPVRDLKRTKLAFLTLVGVKRGAYRLLTADEVRRLKSLIQQV
ncbi:23S rRNA pseudouridine2605 synthase [Sporomusaceae bacterium BoRhaA]|uniref:pseudouridine synthase n=1 Tax=Pelorhabdus rhamnosifermentans TaxID=2772457 RepID=UPI001C061643|nr:pseudouridine synthase [Pelorhabdus rhamnosifermentans]MBU2701020.1 23S rRNA pseudouridine2605 synthase [Pelorhabdus rhamnosifermentans]